MALPHDVTLMPERFSVRRNGTEVILSPSQFLIFTHVANAPDGIRPTSIFDRHYGARADGGPNGGHRVIHQFRVFINKRIAKLNLQIVSTAKSASCAYEIKDKSQNRLDTAI